MDDLERCLKIAGVGRRSLNDSFLENTHNRCKVFKRKGVTVEDEEELCHRLMNEFRCNACNKTFQNLLDYELHYHDSHHFVCAECKKWRPTARLLEIHIQETHDNFFKILAEKQAMYQCFVSECDEKFQNPMNRREHCIQVHEFPKNYRFDESVRVKSKKVSEKAEAMETDNNVQNEKKSFKVQFGSIHKGKAFAKGNITSKDVTNLNNKDFINSKLNTKTSPVTMFIPRQVQQKVNEAAKMQTRRNVLDSGSMMELQESLPKT